MSAATKSALLLAVTLLLGLVIGFTAAGPVDRMRIDRAQGPGRGARGLERHMEETIQPRDEAQAKLIRPVLARAAERNRHIIGNVNNALGASIDSMKLELAPMLDDAQRARLEGVTRELPPLRGPGAPGGFGPPRGRRGGPPFGPPPERP